MTLSIIIIFVFSKVNPVKEIKKNKIETWKSNRILGEPKIFKSEKEPNIKIKNKNL